jgi:hypothetical protein
MARKCILLFCGLCIFLNKDLKFVFRKNGIMFEMVLKIIDQWVKAHYNDLLWGVTLYYFSRVCMFEYILLQILEKKFIIFLHFMLEYILDKISKEKSYFISFYKGEDWNIFVKQCNVRMYSKTNIPQK